MADNPGWTHQDITLDSSSIYNTGTRDAPTWDLYPSIPNAEALAVVSLNVPFSYFAVDSTNNTFFVNATFNATDNVYKVYLIPGTYTAAQFVTMLNAVFTITYDSSAPYDGGVDIVSGSGGAATDLNPSGIDLIAFIYGTTNQLTIYSGAGGTGTQLFSLDFSAATNLNTALGVSTQATDATGFGTDLYTATQGTIYTNPTTTVSSVYYCYAINTINMTGPAFLYLKSDMAQIVKDGPIRTERNFTPLLGAVPVNNNYTGMITYTNYFPEKTMFSKSTLNRITFSLLLGNRTAYCPGFDTTYFTSSGVPIVTPYLQLLGQLFQVVLRFYFREDTLTTSQLNSYTGDKYQRTEAQQEGALKSHNTKFNKNDMKPGRNRSGTKIPGPIRHHSSYPMRAP
jgi:hypothetical protein